MEWRKLGGIFLAGWLFQTCYNETSLLDFLNGEHRCSGKETLTPDQAAQAKIAARQKSGLTIGLQDSYIVFYPEVAASSAPAASR